MRKRKKNLKTSKTTAAIAPMQSRKIVPVHQHIHLAPLQGPPHLGHLQTSVHWTALFPHQEDTKSGIRTFRNSAGNGCWCSIKYASPTWLTYFLSAAIVSSVHLACLSTRYGYLLYSVLKPADEWWLNFIFEWLCSNFEIHYWIVIMGNVFPTVDCRRIGGKLKTLIWNCG